MTIRLLILSAFLSFGFYVVQINSLTASAYAASSSERELQGLKNENKVLETNFTKRFSAVNFSDLAQKLHFEKTNKVTYIQLLSGSVARGNNPSNQ